MDKLKGFKNLIALTAAYYDQSKPDAVIAMQAEDLLDLPYEPVAKAFLDWRKNPKNRKAPLPAEIREIVAPSECSVTDEDLARDIANRIWDSIGRFGWTNQQRAQEHLGEMGWSIVERMGGWQNLCTMDSEERGTFVAQARDFAMSRMRLERSGHGAGGYKIPTPSSPSALPSRIDELMDASTKNLRESTARLDETTKRIEARTREMQR